MDECKPLVGGIDNRFLIEPRDQYDNVIKASTQLGATCTPDGAGTSCPAAGAYTHTHYSSS